MSVDEGTTHGMELDEAIRSLIQESDDGARAYLKQSWLSSAIEALGRARRKAGLTQAQVAERLGTTQSAVARVENNDDGGISLRRYVDYMLACEAFPPEDEALSLADVLRLAIANPSKARTGLAISLQAMIQGAVQHSAPARHEHIEHGQRVATKVSAKNVTSTEWEWVLEDQYVVTQGELPVQGSYDHSRVAATSAERGAWSDRETGSAGALDASDQKMAA